MSVNKFRNELPSSLYDDVLLDRIVEYRQQRHVLLKDEEEVERLQLESALAELEAEAMRRGLDARRQ